MLRPHTSRRRTRSRSLRRFERLEPRWLLASDIDFGQSETSLLAPEQQGFGFLEDPYQSSEDIDSGRGQFEKGLLPELTVGGGGVPSVHDRSESDGGGSAGGSGAGGPNLSIVDAYLRDGTGTRITSPYLGQRVAVQLQFETDDLLPSASYDIHYEVDGVTLDIGTKTFGAGLGHGTWFWWRSGWFASAGSHTVTVTLDPFGAVSETNELDNSISFSFTSVEASEFPQPLIWPTEGDPFHYSAMTNYVDVNPTSGITDYNGGSYAYNGHNAWDLGPPNFYHQDLGVDIYAAADGTVIDTHDGEFDRRTSWESPAPAANYVILDHGDGWTTIYWHLRRDSVQVEVGDVVSAGDRLGYMGSSGVSTGVHIHFGVRHHGFTVEPMYDPDTYLDESLDSFGYIGDIETLIDTGTTDSNPSSYIRERPSDVQVFKQAPSQLVYFWSWYSGLRIGDHLQHIWKRPNGTTYLTTNANPSVNYAQSWYWWSRYLPSTPDLGTWEIDVLINGVKVGDHQFEVTVDGQPSPRVAAFRDIVLDDRVTPLDRGTWNQFSAGPRDSLSFTNHGDIPLELGDVEVPRGFTVIGAVPATLAPGQIHNLTIGMDTSTPGYFGGQVRIDTNNSDDKRYEFSVEGVVQSSTPRPELILGISERKIGEGKQLFGNVRREGTGAALTVNLTSSDTTEVTVPASVVIPAGAQRVIFPINTVQDDELDGDQVVELGATSASTEDAWNELLVVDAAPPVVESVVLNGGAVQRSHLAGARVTFDSEVEIDTDGGSPFHFSNRDTDADVEFTSVVSVVGGKTVVDFEFTTQIDATGSLVDGDYQLQIEADRISDGTQILDGDANDVQGGDFFFGDVPTDAFFRKYGDHTGDDVVNLFDFVAFRGTYLKSVGEADYLAHFDANGDDTVNLFDFVLFRGNYLT